MNKGLSFTERYRRLVVLESRAKEFIKEIMTLTHRSESTVRKWLAGTVEPDDRIKKMLAVHFNTTVKELFPSKSMSYDK